MDCSNRSSRQKKWLLLVWLLATQACALAAAAPSDGASEATVKAAFIYNFAKFVEWQPEAGTTPADVKICVAGVDAAFASTMAALEGKAVQARTVSVRREVKATDLDGCQVLVVGAGARPVAEAARGRSGLLTVSDIRGFAAAGGVIELFEEDGKMRFEINPRAAQRAGLRISSQLLKLAKVTPDQ
ncbi:MAG TPA: YfiR family protein [Burkholderiales bacterium]|nr:YfiR family protein [Burkholderiales bacterium]